ncbi:MAG: hypothetical protein MUE85_14630 [Microscillaceae bacterium]|jgi:hypothetical protein|nr:hypothetical protein [Microscillaceae bacterium]
MLDTPPEIQKKQYEIFFQLPLEERIKQGFEMINFGLMIVENSIKAQNPAISAVDFKIEKPKRLYKNDFLVEELARIIENFRNVENI